MKNCAVIFFSILFPMLALVFAAWKYEGTFPHHSSEYLAQHVRHSIKRRLSGTWVGTTSQRAKKRVWNYQISSINPSLKSSDIFIMKSSVPFFNSLWSGTTKGCTLGLLTAIWSPFACRISNPFLCRAFKAFWPEMGIWAIHFFR